jgi:hypothetical protein
VSDGGAGEKFTCSDLVELATEYLEDALPATQRVDLIQHLDECDDCELYLDQLAAVIRSVSALSSPDIPEASRVKLIARLRERRARP